MPASKGNAHANIDMPGPGRGASLQEACSTGEAAFYSMLPIRIIWTGCTHSDSQEPMQWLILPWQEHSKVAVAVAALAAALPHFRPEVWLDFCFSADWPLIA